MNFKNCTGLIIKTVPCTHVQGKHTCILLHVKKGSKTVNCTRLQINQSVFFVHMKKTYKGGKIHMYRRTICILLLYTD